MANWKIFIIDTLPQLVLSILVYSYDFQLQDFSYLKANPLQSWEIYSIYGVVVFFIFKNVIPKFVGFGGARRHYNDVKDVEEKGLRKFMSKNVFRLFVHILSGATQVLTSGLYVISPDTANMIFTFEFLQAWFIFWDTIHEITGWAMTRSHDGVFQIRAFNLAFMVVKLFLCGQIYRMESATDDFVALVGGIFILTSGFAWVRFTCSVTAFAQCIFYNVDMSALRETWYSWGLWTGQYAIAYRCRVLGDMHLVFAFCAFYFPIELWINRQAKFYWRNLVLCTIGAAFWNHDITTNSIIAFIYLVYGFKYSGIYWKRAPIPGVDYKETKDREQNKRNALRRSASYRHFLPGFLANLVSKNPVVKRVVKCNNDYATFVREDSSARAKFCDIHRHQLKTKTATPRSGGKRLLATGHRQFPSPRMAMSRALQKHILNGNKALRPKMPLAMKPKGDTPRPSCVQFVSKVPVKKVTVTPPKQKPKCHISQLHQTDSRASIETENSEDFELTAQRADVAEILMQNIHLTPQELARKIVAALGETHAPELQKQPTLKLTDCWFAENETAADSPGAFFVSRTPSVRTPSHRSHFHY